ncbi:TIFY 5A-like protein [Drosera capensis]
MRSRSSNQEHQLVQFSSSSSSPSFAATGPSNVDPVSQHQLQFGNFQQQQHLLRPQQMTIFYEGSVSVCDVTELQARAIIGLAAKGAEERRTSSSPTTPLPSTSAPVQVFPLVSLPVAPAPPDMPPGVALSMKRSLQLFLQKRNNRPQAAAPCNNR